MKHQFSVLDGKWFDDPIYKGPSENQRKRTIKRELRHVAYAQAGLNGKRAVERRLRQIQARS